MKKRSSKNLCVTRRQTLALMGASGLASVIRNPVDMLVNGLTQGIIQKAQAADGAPAPRNQIYMYLAGGPNRWTFDLPLTPYSANSDIVKHPHVNTRFALNGTNAGAPEYAAVPITRNGATVNLPWLWKCTIPTAGGGQVPMADLASNLMIIRGVNMTSDGHVNNANRQIRPLSSAPSLNGAVADGVATPVPAVSMSFAPSEVYKSEKGIGQFVGSIADANPLGAVLAPFNRSADPNTKFLSRREAVQSAFDRALFSLGEYAKSGQPGAENLFQMRHSAEALLKQGIGDTAGEFTALKNKYLSLIRAVATSPIPGVSDKPIPYTAGMGGSLLSTNLGGSYVRNADLRTIIQPDSRPRFLAEGCAVAEYLITRGYSSSVMVSVLGAQNFQFENVLNPTDNTVRAVLKANWSFDEHQYGSILTLIVQSFCFRAMAACMYELIASLKSKGLWEETVLHVGSEFSRIPRVDQSGSDHGWSANTTSIFSGAISKPIVLGNMLRDASTGGAQSRLGAWGVSANVKVDGGDRNIHFGNTTSTLAQLLRVKPLMPNHSTLVIDDGGNLTPTIELATNK